MSKDWKILCLALLAVIAYTSIAAIGSSSLKAKKDNVIDLCEDTGLRVVVESQDKLGVLYDCKGTLVLEGN